MADEIIGRREELLALDGFLEAVPAGGRALLLEGDAGIGKTALWQEGVRLARERGFRALTARSTDSELQVAFATVGDLFAPVLDETLPQLLPVQRRALETAFLLREPDGPPPETRLLAAALLSVVHVLAQDATSFCRGRRRAVGRRELGGDPQVHASAAGSRAGRCSGDGARAARRGAARAGSRVSRGFGGFRSSRFRSGRSTVSSGVGSRSTCRDRSWCACTRPPAGTRSSRSSSGARSSTARFAPTTPTSHCPRACEPSSRSGWARCRRACARRSSRSPRSRLRRCTLLEPLAPTTVDDIELAERRGVVEFDGDRIRFTHPLLAPACYSAMPLHRRRRLHRRLAELDVDLEERARHLAIAATGPDEEVAAALDAAAAHAMLAAPPRLRPSSPSARSR